MHVNYMRSTKKREKKNTVLHRDIFCGIHLDPEKEYVVFDILSAHQQLVRQKSREAEAQSVRNITWPYEIFP